MRPVAGLVDDQAQNHDVAFVALERRCVAAADLSAFHLDGADPVDQQLLDPLCLRVAEKGDHPEGHRVVVGVGAAIGDQIDDRLRLGFVDVSWHCGSRPQQRPSRPAANQERADGRAAGSSCSRSNGCSRKR